MPSFYVLIVSLVSCGTFTSQSSSGEGSRDLVILAVGPINDSLRSPAWPGGPALIPAAQQAVDDINNRSDILQNFTLKLLEGESGCEFIDKTLTNFTDLGFHRNLSSRVVGMVGPGCTASAIALSKVMEHPELNIMQISIASSPDINGTKFMNAFRTIGSSLVFVNAYSKLIKDVGWERVGAIYDNSRPFFTSTFKAFRREVGDEVLNFTFALGSGLEVMAMNIRQSCIRVIFVFVGQEDSRRVLCSAFKSDLGFPDFQFLFIERERGDFTNKEVHLNDTDDQVCSTSEMEHALDGVILIKDTPYRDDINSKNTAAGISFSQFNTTYQSNFNNYIQQHGIKRSNVPLTAFRYASGYYDGVWALALALNRTAMKHDLAHTEPRYFGNDMRAALTSLQFEGMLGTITFDKDRRDVPTIGAMLSQCIDNGSECENGTFINGTLIFQANGIPASYRTEYYKIPLPLGISVIAVAMAMAVFLVMLQAAFCKYAHVKEVKATSPHLSHLIFSGCYLFIVVLVDVTIRETFSITLLQNQVTYRVLCSAMYWSFSLGFTLIFGTVASKTWRIYRIFSHFRQGRVRFVANELLLLFVVFLVSIDLALLTVWNTIDPWQLTVRTLSKKGSVLTEELLCTCNHYTQWITILFLYKGSLVALLVILSIFVRRVKRKSFKRTKRVIILIYILVIDFFIGFTLYAIFLESLPILSFFSLAFCLMVAMLIITFTLFLSPVLGDKFLPDSMKTSSFSQDLGARVLKHSNSFYDGFHNNAFRRNDSFRRSDTFRRGDTFRRSDSFRCSNSSYGDHYIRNGTYYSEYYKQKVQSPTTPTTPTTLVPCK